MDTVEVKLIIGIEHLKIFRKIIKLGYFLYACKNIKIYGGSIKENIGEFMNAHHSIAAKFATGLRVSGAFEDAEIKILCSALIRCMDLNIGFLSQEDYNKYRPKNADKAWDDIVFSMDEIAEILNRHGYKTSTSWLDITNTLSRLNCDVIKDLKDS